MGEEVKGGRESTRKKNKRDEGSKSLETSLFSRTGKYQESLGKLAKAGEISLREIQIIIKKQKISHGRDLGTKWGVESLNWLARIMSSLMMGRRRGLDNDRKKTWNSSGGGPVAGGECQRIKLLGEITARNETDSIGKENG